MHARVFTFELPSCETIAEAWARHGSGITALGVQPASRPLHSWTCFDGYVVVSVSLAPLNAILAAK